MSLNRLLLIILSTTLLLVIVVASSWVIFVNQEKDVLTVDTDSSENALYRQFITKLNSSEPLVGRILISTIVKDLETSGLPVDDDGLLLPVEARYINLISGSSSPVSTKYSITHPNVNGLTGDMLFVAQPSGQTYYSPILFSLDQSEIVTRLLDNESGLDENYEVINRRLPKWSSDGAKIIYVGQIRDKSSSNNVELDDVEAWHVFMLDVASRTSRPFAQGFNANWALDGQSVLYMKSDGVYQKEAIATEESRETRVIPSGNRPFRFFNQVGVSKNGAYLAVSYPQYNDQGRSWVDIYRLSLQDGDVVAEFTEQIYLDGADAFWPVFSPGGRYLALQASYGNVADGITANYIVIFDFISNRYIARYPLNDFEFLYTFTNDWIYD